MLFGVAIRVLPVAVSLAAAGAVYLWRRFNKEPKGDEGGAQPRDEFVPHPPPKLKTAARPPNPLWGAQPSRLGASESDKQELQALIDMHRQNPVENFKEQAEALIDRGICFTLREFDFPQKDVEHTAFFPSQKTDTSPMVALIGRSLPHCQTEAEILEAMDDMLHAGGILEGPKILEEIAANHWYDSPEFALRFIKAESTYVHNPRLHNRMKEAVLNLIPEQAAPPAPPYENVDVTHLHIASAIQRILMDTPKETREAFVDSLVQARPAYSGFFNDFARLWLNRR